LEGLKRGLHLIHPYSTAVDAVKHFPFRKCCKKESERSELYFLRAKAATAFSAS